MREVSEVNFFFVVYLVGLGFQLGVCHGDGTLHSNPGQAIAGAVVWPWTCAIRVRDWWKAH